jgi:hypothetical protein
MTEDAPQVELFPLRGTWVDGSFYAQLIKYRQGRRHVVQLRLRPTETLGLYTITQYVEKDELD